MGCLQVFGGVCQSLQALIEWRTMLVLQSDIVTQFIYCNNYCCKTNYSLIFSFVRDNTKKCDDDTDNNPASVLFQRVIRYFDENITVLSKVMSQFKVKFDIH